MLDHIKIPMTGHCVQSDGGHFTIFRVPNILFEHTREDGHYNVLVCEFSAHISSLEEIEKSIKEVISKATYESVGDHKSTEYITPRANSDNCAFAVVLTFYKM